MLSRPEEKCGKPGKLHIPPSRPTPMPPRLLLHLHPTLLLVALVGLPSWSRAQAPPSSTPLTVEYLANEGVLLSRGATVVLIDGLFGDGLADYPTVAPPVRDSLERALGRFGRITHVLVSHVHRDHFGAAPMARHLRANPGARVLGPAEVRDSLRILAGWSDAGRTEAVTPDPAVPAVWRAGELVLEAHGIPHPVPKDRPVQHLVWRVAIGGASVLHVGDAAPTPDQLRAAAGDRLDLLLSPWWLLGGADGRERIAATRARQVAAMHVGGRDRVEVVTGVTVLRAAGTRLALPSR